MNLITKRKKMTIKELKKQIENLPDDAIVYRCSGEYDGSTILIRELKYYPNSSWGIAHNSVVLG